MSNYYLTQEDYLFHHGIKGQKWGVRNYENYDGTLTEAGKIRYGGGKRSHSRKEWKQVKKDMASREEKLRENYFKKHKDEGEKLSQAKNRKRELYKKDVENNSWLLENDNELAKMMYETNTKRSKNAYEKARKAYAEFENNGETYVKTHMQKEFGKDYSDWNNEKNTKAAIALGVMTVGTVAAYTMPLWLWHSDNMGDNL